MRKASPRPHAILALSEKSILIRKCRATKHSQLTKRKCLTVSDVVEEMRSKQVAEVTEVAIERQWRPEMNSCRPVSASASWNAFFNGRCSSSLESTQ